MDQATVYSLHDPDFNLVKYRIGHRQASRFGGQYTFLPDLESEGKFDVESILDLPSYQIDQAQKVGTAGAGFGHKIVAVAIEYFHLANLRSLETGALNQRSCAFAAVIFEDVSGRFTQGRLAGSTHNPVLLHSPGQLARRLAFKSKRCPENHQFIQAAGTIREDQFIPLSNEPFASSRQNFGPHQPRANVKPARACVGVQGSTDCSRNANQLLRTCHTFADSSRNKVTQPRSAAGVQLVAHGF
jgi:hypothetical protein